MSHSAIDLILPVLMQFILVPSAWILLLILSMLVRLKYICCDGIYSDYNR